MSLKASSGLSIDSLKSGYIYQLKVMRLLIVTGNYVSEQLTNSCRELTLLRANHKIDP